MNLILKNTFFSLIPDLFIGVLVAMYRDDSGIDAIITIFITLAAFQCLYFALWLKNIGWKWLIFKLYSKKKMVDHLEKFLDDEEFPVDDHYYFKFDVAVNYFNSIVNNENNPALIRIKAAGEIGGIQSLKTNGQYTAFLQLESAFKVAFNNHYKKHAKEPDFDLDDDHPSSLTEIDEEET